MNSAVYIKYLYVIFISFISSLLYVFNVPAVLVMFFLYFVVASTVFFFVVGLVTQKNEYRRKVDEEVDVQDNIRFH